MVARESISFWQDQKTLRQYPALEESAAADVCVVGAGISGLTVAYLLSKEGKSVVVLDDGPIGGGQTIRTTGHLSNTLDDRYFTLESYFGQTGARLAAESHQAAIDFIESLVKKHKIHCNFEPVDAYLFAPPHGSIEVLKKELKAAHRAGLKKVTLIDRSPIESFDTGPCLLFPDQAQFSPLPYLEALCDLIISQGGKIYTHTHVKKVSKKQEKYLVQTERGPSVRAKHAILATNAYIGNRLFPHTKEAPYRTYVIAGEIPKGAVKKALYYDTLDPYHYIRVESLNAHTDLLISGGEDHRTAEEKHIEQLYEKLEKWTRVRFPMMKEIKYRWSGQVIEPIDCLAFIGRTRKNAEKYLITGDSGNGLTHGTLGALLINDLIHGRPNPWEKIYDPHRITFKAAADFLGENVNSFWQYRDWMTSGEVSSVDEIKPNCGAIVRKGLTKHACYRDSHGKVHEMSALCPHLGAAVRWNDAEKCWECPAHGSRFHSDGEVIQGPANCPLKPLT